MSAYLHARLDTYTAMQTNGRRTRDDEMVKYGSIPEKDIDSNRKKQPDPIGRCSCVPRKCMPVHDTFENRVARD